ncbi:MAG: division/cell wall cluster transcriptional repressor MraZ [Clostridia bacterium]|nr:division/cell wall cluster transcriptional repressor MraZ [Clostridia bacterium]
MLMGEYQHNMDAKGRVTIPSKYREELGEMFYVSKGLDGCLTLYSEAQWQLRVERINACPEAQAKNIRRFVFASTEQVTPDKQGRILISPVLRAHAGLTKDVTVIGAGLTAEIWDTARWQKYNEEMSSADIETEMAALQI